MRTSHGARSRGIRFLPRLGRSGSSSPNCLNPASGDNSFAACERGINTFVPYYGIWAKFCQNIRLRVEPGYSHPEATRVTIAPARQESRQGSLRKVRRAKITAVGTSVPPGL